jgi:N-acetylmuramoyl-L-alanine amidase
MRQVAVPRAWLAGCLALVLTLGAVVWVAARGVAYPPPNLRGVVVAIDPGHGGVDGGAVSPDRKTLEKDLTLQLALRLRAALEAAGAVPVLSREGDYDPSRLPWRHPERYRRNLAVRLATGVEARAVAFVSLHVDITRATRETRRGPNTFYGTRGAQGGRGEALASAIQAEFHRALGVPAKAYPLNVYVIRENPVPAALVECAFLNNPEDLARIRDPAYQEALVRAIVLGLSAYLRAYPPGPAPRQEAGPGTGQ